MSKKILQLSKQKARQNDLKSGKNPFFVFEMLI